ncbi:MAG: SufS family cysteine desulfurase [Thalassotalea sp.]
MLAFKFSEFRELFPLLKQQINGKDLVYFDNAATTQKMHSMIESSAKYYQQHNANVHRGSYSLSAYATTKFETARTTVATLINADSDKEIIWTKGATEAINLVASCLGRQVLVAGDEIVLSQSEHHSNIVPWQLIAEQVGATIKVLALDHSGRIDTAQLDQLITEKTKIVSVTHVSNVIGKINDLKAIINKAKSVQAYTLVDGAQAIAHVDVDVKALDCDFYVFSAHKFYGPTGLGVLYGKAALLTQLPPYQGGGEMVDKVSFSGTSFNQLPYKFEAGTPNIAGVIGFHRALTDYLAFDLAQLRAYEQSLIDYAFKQLSLIEPLQFIVAEAPDVGIFSFTIKGHHHQDIAAYLDAFGIAVRSGSHCAMPLFEHLALAGCVRVSLTAYNSVEEIDLLVTALTCLIKGLPNQVLPADVASTDTIDEQQSAEQIIASFAQAKSWDAKHRQIMLYGKDLTRLAAEQKNIASLINGCESKAWLIHTISEQGLLSFSADSDAKVIRGLLVITISPYQSLTAKQVLTFDIHGYFKKLGLLQHLSPSRGNGLLAIVDKIKAIAQSYTD